MPGDETINRPQWHVDADTRSTHDAAPLSPLFAKEQSSGTITAPITMSGVQRY